MSESTVQWRNYIAPDLYTELLSNIHCEPHQILDAIKNKTLKQERYNCIYDFEACDSFTGYSDTGLLRPSLGLIYIDFDTNIKVSDIVYATNEAGDLILDENGDVIKTGEKPREQYLAELQDQLAKVLPYAKSFCKQLSIEKIPHSLFFSGSKGFHVTFPAAGCFTPSEISEGMPKEKIEERVGNLLRSLNRLHVGLVDISIKNANRKFRAWNSYNNKSGLYKILVASPEHATIEEIFKQAATPQDVSDEMLAAWLNNKCDLSPWLFSLTTSTTSRTSDGGDQGNLSDDSLFLTAQNKKCIESIWALDRDSVKELGFNRHDLKQVLIGDLFYTGVPLDEARTRIKEWGLKVLGPGDQVNKRLKEFDNHVKAGYERPYAYSCNSEIKRSPKLCDARCVLYDACSPAQRCQNPKNLKAKQAKENNQHTQKEKQKQEWSKESGVNWNLFDVKGRPKHDAFVRVLESKFNKPNMLQTPEKNLFEWIGTHWKPFANTNTYAKPIYDETWRLLAFAATDFTAQAITNSVLKLIHMAPPDHNLFSVHEHKINFKDGTVHIKRNVGETKFEFIPGHNKQDYLSYISPIEYNPEVPFENRNTSLGEVPEDHPLSFKRFMKIREETMGHESIRMLKQLLAACLMPHVSRVFFLEGPSNCGKSTMLDICLNLIGHENAVAFNPCHHGDFALQGLLGKRMAYNPDLKVKDAVLRDDVLKAIRDRSVKVTIQRKYETDVQATLPMLHVYCCNGVPTILEGNSGALDNRVSLIQFQQTPNAVFINTESLGTDIWNADGKTVLRYAEEGLKDFVESGHKYYTSEAAQKAFKDHQRLSDQAEAFKYAMENGYEVPASIWNEHVKIREIDGEKRVATTTIWKLFKTWISDENATERADRAMGRNKLLAALGNKKGITRRDNRDEKIGRYLSWSAFNAASYEKCDAKQENNACGKDEIPF